MDKQQQTKQQNLLQLAKQGNSNAIATLLNQLLQPKGCTVQAQLSDRCLYIFVESPQVPHQSAVVAVIQQQLISWNVESIKAVKIYGRKLTDKLASWYEEFSLEFKPDLMSFAADNNQGLNQNQPRNKDLDNHLSKEADDLEGHLRESVPKKNRGRLFFFGAKGCLERVFLVLITGIFTSTFWINLERIKAFKVSHIKNINDFFDLIQVRKTQISGAAWITRQGGNSDVLRGLEIVLCKDNIKPELLQVRQKKWRESIDKKVNNGYGNLNLQAMNKTVASNKDCAKIVKTNVEGKYTISEVPFGSYLIYAPFETSVFKAYWLVPVKVESRQPISLDLENSNMAEIYNR